jgi:transposase
VIHPRSCQLTNTNCRRRLQFQIGRYQQRKYFDDTDWSIGGARLIERKEEFYLNISLKKVSTTPEKAVTPIGIDRGIRTLIAARIFRKKPLIVRGGKLIDYRSKMVRLRRRLQAKGTRSARRLLRHLRHREKRFVLDVCRKTAKQFIEYAIRSYYPVLVFEDLTGIRKSVRRRTKKSRSQLHS